MKKLLLCTLVVLASLCLSAQTTLSKPYSRSLNAATTTGDGLVFVAPLEGGTTPAQWTMTTAVTGFSAIQIQLLGSINNSNWFVLATSSSTTGESVPAATVASFVKCTIVSKTGTGTATCDIASSSASAAYPGVPSCGVGCIAPDNLKVGTTVTPYLTASPVLIGTQGYATDGSSHYVISTAYLRKYSSRWALTDVNATPYVGLPAAVNHFGDGEYYNGKIYLPAQRYVSCSDHDTSTIAAFAVTAGMPLSGFSDISATAPEISAVAVVPARNSLFLASYCDGSKLWEYDLATFAYKGTVTLSASIDHIQGLSWDVATGNFAAIADTATGANIWAISLTGVVNPTPLYVVTTSAEVEGLNYGNGAWTYLADNRLWWLTNSRAGHALMYVDDAGTLGDGGVLSSVSLPRPNLRWSSLMVAGNTSLSGHGESYTATGAASSAKNNSVGTAPTTVNYATAAATSGTLDGISGKASINLGRNPILQAWVQLANAGDYVATRAWILWANSTTQGAAAGSDTPAGVYVGFRASTVAGDTHWMCVAATGAAAIDSGITVNTAGHTFEVVATATTLVWKISGNQVCTATNTVDATADLATWIENVTQENVVKNIRIGYVYQEQDTPQ